MENNANAQAAPQPSNDLECCGNCVFALLLGEQEIPTEQGNVKVQTGFCRRYPPQMLSVLAPVNAPSKIVGRMPEQVGLQAGIQPTFASTHSQQWCGEHTRVEEYEAYKAARLGMDDLQPEQEVPT